MKPYTINFNNPKDSPEEIAQKLNSLSGAIDSSVVKGVIQVKDFEELNNKFNKYVSGNKERIDTNDLRWHGGGLSAVAHDSTLSGTGSISNPLSVVGNGAVFSLSRGWGAGVNPASTSYNDTTDSGETVEASVGNIMPFAGTVRNLFIDIYNAQIDSGTVVFTLMKNGISTSVTVSMSATVNALSSDTTHSFSVAAGDRVSLKSVVTGGTTNTTKFCFSYSLN